MTDSQNYSDNSGAQWSGASGNAWGVPQRPAFLNRTEPMGQQQRGHAEAATGQGGIPQPQPQENPSQPQWNAEMQPHSIDPEAANTGDPELAAAAGIDAASASHSPVPPTPPPAQAPQEPPRVPPAQSNTHAPTTPPPAAPPPGEPRSSVHEATQVHNPVSRDAERGRTYPSQVAERPRASGFTGVIINIGTVIALLLTLYMLIRALAAGVFDPSAMLSGGFALVGLPLVGVGLHGAASQSGPDNAAAWLRAPYVQLISGLALLLAAGMAA